MNIMSFGKNTLYYAIGIIAIRFTTFLLLPLYTGYLTQEEYGLLATLLFTTEIIITINDVGMRSAFMRFYSDFLNNNKLSELIGSSVLLNILVGLFLIIITTLIPDSFISQLFNVEIIQHLVILTVLAGITKTLSLNILSYFRAKNLGSAYMIISILTSILLVILTWVGLVVKDWGIIGVLYAQVISFGTVWLTLLIWIILKEGFYITPKTLRKLYKFGYPLILATSGSILVNTSGNYFLGIFRSLEEVALFAIAFKLSTIGVMVLIAPFQLTYEPYIFNNKNNPNLKLILSRIVTYITLAYLIVSLGIIFVFKYLIQIIGSSTYIDSYPLIYLLLPGFLFTAFNYIGQSLIHLNNKTKTTGIASFLIILISIIISYFGTRAFGTFGTIIGINFYLIVSGIVLFYLGYKEYPIKLEYKRITIIFILGIFLFITIYMISSFNNILFYCISSIIFIIASFIVYKSNFFYKEEKIIIEKSILSLMKFIKVKK